MLTVASADGTSAVAVQLAAMVGIGIGAQWLAQRLKLPSILLLLTCGILAGPLTGWVRPGEVFSSDLLGALVSLSVAIILFEGGLSLRWHEAREVGSSVVPLVTVGVVVQWAAGTIAAIWLLDLDLEVAALLGAILVLSGPTVVGPLLRHVRPKGTVGAVLKWEGIVVDPVGALLATLVYEWIAAGHDHEGGWAIALTLVQTFGVGALARAICARIVLLALERHWVPDRTQAPVVLATAVVTFVGANALVPEAGLVAVTVSGFLCANQRRVRFHHITVFKEHLTQILIPCLFVVLASRLSLDSLRAELDASGLAFLLVLLLVARPLAVMFSTAHTTLRVREKAFLAWLFPRGIVAAAVTPLFAQQLVPVIPDAARLEALVVLVILGTVAVYGLTCAPVARLLNVQEPDANGLLVLGSNDLTRDIAAALDSAGVPVLLLDRNSREVMQARMQGLRAARADIFDEEDFEHLDLSGMGKFLAATPNDELNSLAALHCAEHFGRMNCYQLAPDRSSNEAASPTWRGRTAFGESWTSTILGERVAHGHRLRTTALSPEFDLAALEERHGPAAVRMFWVKSDGTLHVTEGGKAPPVGAGDVLVSLLDPEHLQTEESTPAVVGEVEDEG